MHPFLDYFIKANGLLLFFWLFYRLFLHKETFYTTNRWYLLGSIALSIIAPFITFTKTVFIEAPKPTIDWKNLATIDTQNTIVEENLFTIENFAIVIIGLISTILVLKTLFQLARTYHKIKQLPYDATLQVRRSSDETIFSLYPYIVVPIHFEEFSNYEMILTHEKVHIQQKHSFDMIVMQLIRSVFWMNPLLRYFQKDIELNLEYIVDAHLQTQFDSKTYQLSLLSFHSATPQPFVNSFNSQLKKRILQINAKKSNPMKKLKIALTAPVLLAFFGLFQIETIAQVKTEEIKNNDKKEITLISKKPLYLVDGKEMNEAEFRKISPNTIKSIKVVNEGELIEKYGAKAKNGILIVSTLKDEPINKNKKTTQASKNSNRPLYFVDDKEISEAEFRKISPDAIQSIKVLNEGELIEKYGTKNGIILISTNKKLQISDNTEKDIETVTSIFNNLKKDIKKLEDDDLKITNISSSITQADGTKITISENY